MKYKYQAWLGAVLLLGASVAQGDLPPHSMAGGGGLSQYGTIRVHATIGQPFVGAFSNTYVASGTLIQSGVGFWFLTVGRSAVPDTVSSIPNLLIGNRLDQNVPNPFNPSTEISFSLAAPGHARLRLFNLKGEKVADLVDQTLAAGQHSLVFRPTELASGVYFYQLEVGGFRETRRLLLLK